MKYKDIEETKQFAMKTLIQDILKPNETRNAKWVALQMYTGMSATDADDLLEEYENKWKGL